jgi:glycosyltransferase involved in cell wall biosynthesis
MAPRFSVVIAAYNAERMIAAAVRSVLAQTCAELELIVVDDGSTDRTAAVVGGFDDPRVRLLAQSNRGPAAARNAGIAAAAGVYIGFLDSDDLWMPDYLELTGSALDAADNPGFAYTDAYVFDDGSGRVRRQTAMERMEPPVPPPADRDRFLLELLQRNFVYVSTTVPKRVLDQVGGYDPTLSGAADYELWMRITAAGYTPVWVPGQHALYRQHAGQMHFDLVKMARDVAAAYGKLSSVALPSDAHREVLAQRLDEIERHRRALTGEDRVRWAVDRLRWRAIRARQRAGFGDTWRERPPSEVHEAFGDLAAL